MSDCDCDRLRAMVDELFEEIRQLRGGAPAGHPQRARAIIEANQLTLSREERHEIAEWLTGHEGSWSRLPEEAARRVADGLSAFIGIQWVLAQRVNRQAEAESRLTRPLGRSS